MKPSKADREAAVHVVYGTTNRLAHVVPGYLWSWVDTGYGHGLPEPARVISELRRRTQRLALCEALEMLGGDGHDFVHGERKAAPMTAIAAELKKLVGL